MDIDFRGLQERLRQRLLAEIREGQLTGLQLARESGFRQAHISNFLNSKRGLSLEAMDAVLKARGWRLADLIGERRAEQRRGHSLQANSPGVSWIPLVDAENCHASEVPYEVAKNALKVMAGRLGRIPEVLPTARGSWIRFVAMRVSAEDAEAMAPRLARGAMVVIDRHAYVPGGQRSIYAVRVKTQLHTKIVMRSIERVGRQWVMKAANAEVALARLEDMAEIVGRVRMMINEM